MKKYRKRENELLSKLAHYRRPQDQNEDTTPHSKTVNAAWSQGMNEIQQCTGVPFPATIESISSHELSGVTADSPRCVPVEVSTIPRCNCCRKLIAIDYDSFRALPTRRKAFHRRPASPHVLRYNPCK